MLAVAFDAHRLITHLDARLETVLRTHGNPHRSELLSVTLSVPELATLQLTELPRGSIYWARPEDQNYKVAMGNEAIFETGGQDRFRRLEQRFNLLRSNWLNLDPDELNVAPQAFVGFSFSPGKNAQGCWQDFPNACLRVPTLLLERSDGTCRLTFTSNNRKGMSAGEIRSAWLRQALNLFVEVTGFSAPYDGFEPLTRVQDIPSERDWLHRVDKVLEAIARGQLDKVVLTRRIRVASRKPLQAARSLSWLAARQRAGVQFAYATTQSILIGASPERLISLRGDKIVCDAVAGTACRDQLSDRDRELGLDLLADAKARHEQSLVVSSILNSLEPLCSSLNAPVEPQLLKSSQVQHLWSPIHGRVRPGTTFLNLAAKLHPTPAVGGTPRAQAVTRLEQLEDGQRGWYTGALGWMDKVGNGELTVVLRCALLRHNIADLFAGAGIVGDSDPQAELAETEWKLRTMLDALANC